MVRITADDLGPEEGDLLDYLSDSDEEVGGDGERRNVEAPVQLATTFPEWIAIVNLPEVEVEKLSKLEGVLRKRILTKVKKGGDEFHEDKMSLHMITDEAGKGTGVCFVEFASQYEAECACKRLQGEQLDKSTPLGVCELDKFEDITQFKEEYSPPEVLNIIDRSVLRDWMSEETSQHYLIRQGDKTEVNVHNPLANAKPNVIFEGPVTQQTASWSPQGSFLVTFHWKGMFLRGMSKGQGPFNKLARFPHEDIQAVQFTPDEQYAITWDGSLPKQKVAKAYCVWRVVTSSLIRTFAAPNTVHSVPTLPPVEKMGGFNIQRGGYGVRDMESSDTSHTEWTQLAAWSHDGAYLAMIQEREVGVYVTPSLNLLETDNGTRESLKYDAAKLMWSPSDNILAVWVPELGDAPGRLICVDIPSRRELSSKTVFSVVSAELLWQNEGRFLALLTRISRKVGKRAKREVTQIEIFRVKEKNFPVDTLQLDELRVKSMKWECGGNRLAAIVQDETTRSSSLRIYCVAERGTSDTTQQTAVYPLLSCFDSIFWSPIGANLVLSSSLPTEGSLIFCQLSGDGSKVEELHKDDHSQVNHISWEPSGRYVCTAVVTSISGDNFRLAQDAGFKIWSFQGRLQYADKDEKFHSFEWRPNPLSLLSKSKLDEIPKRLKEYSKRYDEIDERVRSSHDEKTTKRKNEMTDVFNTVLMRVQEWAAAHESYDTWKAGWEALDESISWEVQETQWEEEVGVTETPQ